MIDHVVFIAILVSSRPRSRFLPEYCTPCIYGGFVCCFLLPLAPFRAIPLQVLTVALGGDLPGADDFLPAMIYVLKTANPPHLASNLTFVQEYCPKVRVLGTMQ